MSRPASAALSVASVALFARLPGLVHGFERRPAPARPETRDETRARVTAALAEHGTLHLLSQVHGSSLREAPWHGQPEGDAAVTRTPGVLVGVETADCLPVLLVDPVRRAAAAAHAGWRGTAQGVARVAVESLIESGSRADELLAALGPGIGACCYEVGEELRAAFAPAEQDAFRAGPRGRPHLDVRELNRRQLLAAGLRTDHIADVAECTRCRPDYHSYRRDGSAAGRMISFVGWAGG